MTTNTILSLADYVRDVPDFPKPGILFRDIGPLQREKLRQSTDAMLALFSQEELEKVDAFAGMEARGFPFAAAMADRLGKGFIMVRKKDKLPPPVASSDGFGIEYRDGEQEPTILQIARMEPLNVIVIDDVLATGNTMAATLDLFKKEKHGIIGCATLINLTYLNAFEWQGQKCRSVLHYDGQGVMNKTDCQLSL